MLYLIAYTWRKVGTKDWKFDNTLSETPYEDFIRWNKMYRDEEYVLINILEVPIEYRNKLNEII